MEIQIAPFDPSITYKKIPSNEVHSTVTGTLITTRSGVMA
jgi:hypothetical protein